MHYTSPTIEYLFDIVQANKNEIQLLVALVKYKTKLVLPRRGVCSTYLASLKPEPGLHSDLFAIEILNLFQIVFILYVISCQESFTECRFGSKMGQSAFRRPLILQ